jgi:HAE1 family hydrophobic/amphiphilic exporter-1
MEAIGEQSVIGRPGRVRSGLGARRRSRSEYVLTYQGRYNTPEQYEDIIIRATPDGQTLAPP